VQESRVASFSYEFHDRPIAVRYEVYRDTSGACIVLDRVVDDATGDEYWVVRDDMRRCLSVDGLWDYEIVPTTRPERWVNLHRFSSLRNAWHRARNAAQALVLDAYEEQEMLDPQRAPTKRISRPEIPPTED